MILNSEQRTRMQEFMKFITIDDLCDIMRELPCFVCPLHEKCPMKEEMDVDEDGILVNSCHDVIKQYITTGEIIDRRNEEN